MGVMSVRRSGDPRVRGLAAGGKRIRTQRGPIFGGPARAIPTEFGRVRPCCNVGGADLSPCYLVLDHALSPPYWEEQVYLHTIWFLIVLYLLLISSLSPSCLLRGI